MRDALPTVRSHFTLALCTILHAFTHAYGSMLVPLYLLMTADLRLGSVRAAAAVVTVYGMVYNLLSYGAGVLADRFDRKALLGLGLLGNAAAIALMGLTRDYHVILGLAVLAGVSGTIFHPAANALVPAHYPKSPGMAIGILGAGSGLGFWFGPRFAGARAEAGWHFAQMAGWQRPCVELGIVGLIVGVIFLLVAREPAKRDQAAPRLPMDSRLKTRVALLAAVLGCRDFAGVAGMSLAAIFLQKAWGYSTREAGIALGWMMLISLFGNPLAVWLTPGRRRLPWLTVQLILGGAIVASTPFWSGKMIVPVLVAFQTFQLTSYAVSDAGTLERVPAELRGRVVGLFLLIAGTFAATGPWIMGYWTDALGTRAADARAYVGPFGLLAAMMFVAACSTPLIARLGEVKRRDPVGVMEEVSPATRGGVM